MANLLQTLISIITTTAFLLLSVTISAKSQTISFAYDFSGQKPKDLTFEGDAHFPTNSTFLRLTNARRSNLGRVLYPKPVRFWETGGQVDFETTIKFNITPNTIRNPADGLTFFVSPVGTPAGAGGSSFGVFNSSGMAPSVFAVEFDPYWNRQWDPIYGHVGIDLGSRISRKTAAVGDALVGQPVTAQINYVGATKMISVNVSAGSRTFHLSYNHDLSGFLPQQVQVGLSAATGAEYATHDVVSWYLTATMVHSFN